jgi:hypothetical protein
MIHSSSHRRFEVPNATGASRIVSLPTATRLEAPQTLTTFQDIFRAALAQAERDHELNRLFNADFYEI